MRLWKHLEEAVPKFTVFVVCAPLDPFRTTVPFGGQITQILSRLTPKRDCGPNKGVFSPITRVTVSYGSWLFGVVQYECNTSTCKGFSFLPIVALVFSSSYVTM